MGAALVDRFPILFALADDHLIAVSRGTPLEMGWDTV